MSQNDSTIALVVDDSPETIHLMVEALEEAGITVLMARSGARAIETVERIEPDIILLDADMPGINGFETAQKIKAMKSCKHIPIIFITGLSDSESVLKGLKTGGVDYITKPVSPDELIARAGIHIANARIAKSVQSALDLDGRPFVALNGDLSILWSTPTAETILTECGLLNDDHKLEASGDLKSYLDNAVKHPTDGVNVASQGDTKTTFPLIYVGRSQSGDALFHVRDPNGPSDVELLEEKFSLTTREAEVVLWVAKGKSNRDIAEILSLSARTVNKHLEPIFAKLGVENRTAAATIVVRALHSI